MKAFIIDAANKAQAKGTDLSKHTYFVRDNKTGAIKDINWEAYNQFVSRSKAPGAFDSRSNDSGENTYSVQVLQIIITLQLLLHYTIQHLTKMYT